MGRDVILVIDHAAHSTTASTAGCTPLQSNSWNLLQIPSRRRTRQTVATSWRSTYALWVTNNGAGFGDGIKRRECRTR